ncbi:hypothetical protein QJQ45_010535 [Haematococcus lacustris]|nr:hypothetical protein QJQ45_010535 [Haematococcus lacustris]
MSQRDMQHQVAVDGGASATDGYSPAGEVPPPASRLLDLPPALLDDIACRVMQLGSRSLLPLTCRAFSQAHLLHIPALRIQLGRQRCDQLLTPRVVTALQARKSKLVITLWQPKKGDSAAFKWQWAPTLQLPHTEYTQHYHDLLAHALAKLDNCAAVEVCRLFSGEYHPNIHRHLRCPPGLAQHLLDSFPSLTALTLQGFLVSSNTLASLLSHPPLARQLQQLHLTTTYVLNGDKPLCSKPLAQLLVLTITCQQVQLQGLAELLQVLPQLHTLQLPGATVRGQQKLDTLLAANQITSIQLQEAIKVPVHIKEVQLTMVRQELQHRTLTPTVITPTLLQHQRVDLAQLVSLLQPLQSCFVGKVQVRCLHEVTGADVLALAPLCRDCTHFELRGGSVEPSVDFWHQLVQLMPAVQKVDFIRVEGCVSAAMHELDSSNACIIPDDNSFVTTHAVPDTMPDSSGQARSGVGKTCLARAMVAQQAAKGGSGGAPLFFSVGERLRADGLLAKHVAPDERAACVETMRATARDLISRKLHALGQRVLVLEAVKDREGADDLAELLEQHSVPLLQQQLWWLEKALGIGWAGGQGGPPAHSLYGHPQVLYLPHDVSSAVATWGFGESRKRDAQHQVAERQAKWQRAAGWLLELYSSLGSLAEVGLLDMKGGSAQQPSLAALGYAAPAPECSWLAAAGWAPLGRWKKSSDTSSSSSSSSSSPGSSSAVSRSSMQQTWPGLAITPQQPVTSCRLVSCSRARAAVVAEAEAFTGLHPLPLPVPSRSVTCTADACWLAYPGRYLAALKADGVRHLLITTATGQPFLLNRAGALYAYPMQTAPSQPAAAGQEGALGGKAVIEGEEQEVQQAASAGHIVLEKQLQQLSLHSSRAAEGQVAPARACDVVALPPAAPPPCGLPPCTVLDGELVLHGGGAQPLFLVFDALCVAGSRVWQLPLTARLQHLDSLGLTTASEAVTGQAAASVFTPLPALKVSVAVPLPAATAEAPPGFVKQQQGPPRGQDTVLVLRKPCFPVSPSGLLQLQAAAKHCGFPADGVVFSPCAMSCVLGQAELLIKWQPPGCVGVDVLGRLANSLPQPSLMTIDDNIHLQRLRGPGAPDALVRDYMHRQVEVEKVSVNFGATYYHNYHDTQRPGKQQSPAPQPPTITKLEGIAWIMRCLCFDKVMGKSLEALERLTYRICLPWSDLVRAVEHQQQQQQQQTARPPSALHSPTLQSSPIPPNPDLVPAALTSPHPARLLPFSQLYALALAAVQCGSVEVSSDPDTGLQVFNYLAAASPGSSQAEQLCRGLVDGSLIIGFLWQGQVHACTRRRMTSEQAVWAQGQLRANPDFVAHAQPGWTYLFEAVYAANTHVISYPFQGLVLLDAICPAGLGLASGAAKHALAARLGTLAAPELQLQQAEELGSWLQADRASSSSTSSFAVLLSPSTPRPTPSQPLASDGWVVTLGSSGQRSKLVHANFKHAHYEAQLLHPLSVWDRVRQGASRDQLLSFCLPNHLRAEAEAVLAALHRSFDEVRLQHMAKQQAVAAKQHGGREEQPLSMYYSKVQVSLPEGSATPHLRAQLLDLVRPAHDGSGLPGYQPSPAMAQTFAKSWPKGPLAGRLAPSPEPACTAIQRPQFFELVLAALDGISALRVKSVCWTWCRLVRGWPGLVAAVEKSKQTSAKQCDDGSSADYDDGYYDFRSEHVKQVVGDARRDADLYDLLAGTRREETYQPYFSGWPGLLRPLSPTIYDLPAMIQEKYRTCQTMCFCGVFPQINRAWASIDNSLFLWRYDRSGDVPVEYGGEEQAICAVGLARPRLSVFLAAIQHVIVLCTTTVLRVDAALGSPHLDEASMLAQQLALLALALVSPWSNSRRSASLDSPHLPLLTSLHLCLV